MKTTVMELLLGVVRRLGHDDDAAREALRQRLENNVLHDFEIPNPKAFHRLRSVRAITQ